MATSTLLPEVSVRSEDVDEARDVATRVYHPHKVTLIGDRVPGRFGMTLQAVAMGPLTVGWLTYDSPVRIETGELGYYQVNVPGQPIETTCGSEATTITPGRAAVYHPARPTSFTGWRTCKPMFALRVSQAALEREAELLLDRPLNAPLDVALELDISEGGGAQWWAMVRSAALDLASPQALIRHPMVAAPLARSIMAGFLLAARHDLSDELHRPVTATVGNAAVRAAKTYMNDHAAQPITVNDVARHAGVSVRALQEGFKRAAGSSPMDYLRHVRLREAHRELLAADPDRECVAAVAARWGFTNAGRFARLYRETYGATPLETLRRRS